MMMVR